MKALTGLSFLAAALLASEAGAQEWTRFRGPNGTGISPSKGVPVKWTQGDFLWRVPLPGDGDGHPVLWGDKLFVTSAVNQGRERLVLCLRKEDGKRLWERKIPMATHGLGKSRCWALTTPAVDAERLVACFADPQQYRVIALDHSGKDLWTVELGPFESQHGQGSSPIFFEDKVILTNDQDGPSFVTALEAKTGKTVWRTPRKPAPQGTAYGTPCILQRDGGQPELILLSKNHGVSCLDARTGTPKWEAPVFDKRCVASPVVVGNIVLGSCGQGGGKGNFLSAVRLGGKEAYTIRTPSTTPYVPTPVAVGDRFFMVSDFGIASCVEASTGRVVWSERLGGNYFGSPVLAGGKLYAPSREGECAVFEAADQFKLVSKNPLGEGTHAAPAIDSGRIYFRTFTHLVCVGGK